MAYKRHKRNFQGNFNLDKFVAVDEMMVRYKGRYYPIRQYISNKPIKWRIKIRCLADSTSRYIWDINIYQGTKKWPYQWEKLEGGTTTREKCCAQLGGPARRPWPRSCNGQFLHICWFTGLASRNGHLCHGNGKSELHWNSILVNKKTTAKLVQGNLLWEMHNSWRMCSVT